MTSKAAARTGETQFSTPTEKEIVMRRVFDAPRKLVWAMWTEPKHVTQWMLGPEGWTMPVCEIDLRPGGTWRFVWRNAEGQEMTMTGVYKEIRPPEKLVNTERWGPEWPETLNTLELTERDGKTTMVSTMRYPSKAARDAALKTGMKEGTDMSFARMDAYLERL